MNLFREKWILPGFILNIILVAAIAFVFSRRNKTMKEIRTLERSQMQIALYMKDLRNSANRIGNRANGYAFTHYRGFLLDINQEQLKNTARRVNNLTIGGAEQKERVNKLLALSDSLFRINLWVIEKSRTAVDEEALMSVGASEVLFMSDFNETAGAFEDEENSLYNKQIAVLENQWNRMNTLQWILVSIVTGLLFFVYFLIRYHLTVRKEAEAKLSSNKLLLQSIVDNTSAPVSVKQINGEYQLVNKQFEKIYNVTDVVGKTDLELFPSDVADKSRNSDIEVVKNKQEIKYEESHSVNGQKQTFLFAKFPIKDAAGNISGIGAIGTNISEQKKEDETLRTKEAQLKTIIDNGPDAIIVMNQEGKIIKWNPKARELFHYTEQEVLGQPMHELIMSEEFWEQHLGGVSRFLKTGEAPMMNKTVEVKAVNKENKELDLELTISATKANGGYLFIAFIREIVARKQMERQIIEARNFLDSIIENIPDMIFVKDAKELRFVRFNRAGEKLLGYSSKELIGKNDFDFFPKEQAEFFIAKDREVLNKGMLLDIQEEEIDTKNGKRILHTKKIPIRDEAGKPRYLLGISYDITETKRLEKERTEMEKTIRQNEQQMRLILENIGEGVIVVDTQEHVVLSNQMAEEIFETDQISSADISDYYNVYYPDGETEFPSQNLPIERGLKGEVSDMEILVEDPESGNKKLLHVSGRPIVGEDNSVIAAVSTIRDVTSYKNLEKALEESEIKYRRLIGFARHKNELENDIEKKVQEKEAVKEDKEELKSKEPKKEKTEKENSTKSNLFLEEEKTREELQKRKKNIFNIIPPPPPRVPPKNEE